MNREVHLVQAAEDDLFDLYQSVAHQESPETAAAMLDQLYAACASLGERAERGHRLPELTRIGIDLFREIHWKVYRIIYLIEGDRVYVHAVIDGRRDIEDLLQRRLLR